MKIKARQGYTRGLLRNKPKINEEKQIYIEYKSPGMNYVGAYMALLEHYHFDLDHKEKP